MRSRFAMGLLLAGLVSANPAEAVRGDQPVRAIVGERAERVSTPARQRALNAQPAWQDLLARRGQGWTARWDEATATPVRFYGSGWPVDAARLATDAGAFAIARQILTDESALLGRDVHPADLVPLTVDRRGDIVTVTFQQTWRGLPVDATRVSLRFKADRFVMGQFETLPVLGTSTTPTIDADTAVVGGLSGMGWLETATDVVAAPTLVILPIRGALNLETRLAWKLELRAPTVPAHREVWVDAATGRLLGYDDKIRFASGRAVGLVDDRYPENGLAEFPIPLVAVSTGSGTVTADAAGQFAVGDSAPVDVSWGAGSEHFDIDSDGGDTTFEGVLAADGDDVVVTSDPNAGAGAQRRQLAQLDVHVSAHIVRDRALHINPNFSWAGVQAEANVNLDDGACNAYFDPSNNPNNSSINFLRQGNGCNNTGRAWDVIYHEYGHGFHIWNIIPGAGDYDGAIGEGFGDYLSATVNDDPGMGRGFFQGSSNPLRNIEPNAVWPDDIDQDIHITGLIAAGALWDLRSLLVDAHGEEAGVDHADFLYWAATMRASDTETVYDEVLFADDDNGNINDGTPNRCLIDEAFGLHGLGPGSGGLSQYFVDFEPLGTDLAAGAPVELELRTTLSNPDCADGSIQSVQVHWTVDTGLDPDAFESVTFTTAGADEWTASLPALEEGSYLRYWLELVDDSGDVAGRLPEGSVSDPWFGAWIGGGDVTFSSDFEDGVGSWTHALLDGQQQEGADDWMLEEPKGTSGDPTSAHSGDLAWGNDLTPEDNWNGAYQPNIHNVLRSPSLPADGARVHLQFRRWLNVEDGFWDQAWVTVNGSTVWENYSGPNQEDSSNHHEDLHWAFRSYDISDLVEDGVANVEWHLQSDQGLQMGGWTIDDVCIRAPATVDNRLGITDFEASEGEDGGVRLTWTNPAHAPLAEVRVVRQRGACPTDAHDGEVVFFDLAPVLDASVEVFDPTPTTDSYCYGVFPSDGDALLGFAVEGWNLDTGSASSRASKGDIQDAFTENGLDAYQERYPEAARGCGCNSGAPAGLGFGLLALLFVRRRTAT